jgi:transposase InsO family protein
MSRKRNCRDNAMAESFFSSLKKERVKKTHLQDPRARAGGSSRVHRRLLQSSAPSQPPGRHKFRPVRGGSKVMKVPMGAAMAATGEGFGRGG